MRQLGQSVGPDEATDAELACRAGAGDLPAFEELYRRHVETAWRVALAVSANPDDAADAVSDAFTRVLQALPERLQAADYFLPYLLTAVRNAAIDVLRRGGRQRPTDLSDGYESSVVGPEPAELMVAGADADLIARAFRSLPERWRSVLWLTEVEGIPARDVAGLLGVSANGVAQLAVRARAGLRQRFLQAHLRGTEVQSLCRDTVDHLGAYAAGALAPRDIAKADQHLAGCATCRSRLAQLEELAPSLRRAVLPLPAGLAALALGRWRVASTGATGAAGTAGATSVTVATAAGPASIAVGAAVVAAPAPFIASFAAVALLVAGIVGVGVVEHHRQASPVPSANVVQAPGASSSTTGAPGEQPRFQLVAADPVAGLVDGSTRTAAGLNGLSDTVAGSLPSGLPVPPAAAGLNGIGSAQDQIGQRATSIAADLAEEAADKTEAANAAAGTEAANAEAPAEAGAAAESAAANTEAAAANAAATAAEARSNAAVTAAVPAASRSSRTAADLVSE